MMTDKLSLVVRATWLDRALQAAKLALVLVLIWATVALTLKTGAVLDHASAMVTDAARVLQSVSGTTSIVRKAAEEQRVLTAETTKKTNALLDIATAAAKDFDKNLNKELLPAATASIKQVNETLLPQAFAVLKQMNEKTLPELTAMFEEGGKAIRENSEETKETLRRMQQVVLDLHALTGDPQWLQIAQDLDTVAKNLASATGNVSEGTKLALERLRQALKPGNFIWGVIQSLLGVGSKARIVIGK